MLYIQDKLNELIETYRKETGFTEYDARMIAERLLTDYHNHIVEILDDTENLYEDTNVYDAVKDIKRILQDTNLKE